MPDYSYTQNDASRYFANLKALKSKGPEADRGRGLRTAVAGQHPFNPAGGMRDNAKISGIRDVLQRNYEVSALYHDAVDNSARGLDGTNKADRQLKDLGRYIAWWAKGDFIAGPLKGTSSLMPKLLRDYGGDVSQLKDVVRCTIVGNSVAVYNQIINVIKSHCTAEYGYKIIKPLQIDFTKDPCGYSGANYVVLLPCQRPGEIQVNVPPIMYAKNHKQDYMNQLQIDVAKYEQLERKFRVEGGFGHELYEIWRDNQSNKIGERAADLSKRYYAYFRLFPKVPERAEVLQADLDSYKSDNKALLEALKKK